MAGDAASPGPSIDEAALAERTAPLVEAQLRDNRFSGAVLLAHRGRPILRRGFGLANREWQIPNRPDTRFHIASITKQFTAAAILLLAEAGKLELDDPVARHYRSAPEGWEAITIRHLLTHGSGIPSYTDLPNFAQGIAKIQHTPAELLAYIRNQPLQFEPGAGHSYSNTGYVLLGHLISTLSGEGYGNYVRSHIFEKLGMRDSGYGFDDKVIPGRATGYLAVNNEWLHAPYLAMTVPYAAGALYSTVDDLLVWDRALEAGTLLSPQSQRAMFTDYGHEYGLGWQIETRFNRLMQAHDGGISGFSSMFCRFPGDGLTIIVLANVDGGIATRIAFDLAALAFDERSEHRAVKVDPASFDAYVGTYEIAPDFVLAVTRSGEQFFVRANRQPKFQIFAESPRGFFYRVIDAAITFEVDRDGRAFQLILHRDGKDTIGRRTG